MKNFDFIRKDQILYKSGSFYIVEDSYPVSPGHMLIISRTENRDYFGLSQEEHNELYNLIRKCKELIESIYSPDGYNIGFNCGEAAGQTVFQFHCHVIPRYKGDMKNPQGGIIHCVHGKGNYKMDVEIGLQ